MVFDKLYEVLKTQFWLGTIFDFQMEATNTITRPLLGVTDAVSLLTKFQMHKGNHSLLFVGKHSLMEVTTAAVAFLEVHHSAAGTMEEVKAKVESDLLMQA